MFQRVYGRLLPLGFCDRLDTHAYHSKPGDQFLAIQLGQDGLHQLSDQAADLDKLVLAQFAPRRFYPVLHSTCRARMRRGASV
eukprot:IDg8930t1